MVEDIHYKNVSYGFEYGSVRVNRVLSEKDGRVTISLSTPRQELLIQITPSGLIRLGEIEPANHCVPDWSYEGPVNKKGD